MRVATFFARTAGHDELDRRLQVRRLIESGKDQGSVAAFRFPAMCVARGESLH